MGNFQWLTGEALGGRRIQGGALQAALLGRSNLSDKRMLVFLFVFYLHMILRLSGLYFSV